MNATTDRLDGVPVTAGHAPALHERLYSDPRVMATLGGATRTLDETRAGLERFSAHWAEHGFGPWVFTAREDGRVAGIGGLLTLAIEEGPVPSLLTHMAADVWGRGFATEIVRCTLRHGFEVQGMETIYAWTLPENRASRRVMEKCGMARFREGTYRDLPHVFYRI